MKLPKKFLTQLRKNKDKIVGLKSLKERRKISPFNTCQYFYEDGSCCVIGALLPPIITKAIKKKKGSLNRRSVQYISNVFKLNLFPIVLSKLTRLQGLHDSVVVGRGDITTFKDKLEKVLETGEL